MKRKDNKYGPYKLGDQMSWDNLFFLEQMYEPFERTQESYDFLREYSTVFNHYTASTPQPNPFSNKVMFIINTLTKMGVKYSIDIFSYEGNDITSEGFNYASHKLVNIIAEPNPNATGPATVFCAHHDVANVRSENCQDNGASVCNLLKLASMIYKAQDSSKRTIILFSDCEEYGARGAKRFARNSSFDRKTDKIFHNTYGEIESVINLELTGKGKVVWSDCKENQKENDLHQSLENVLGKTILKLHTPPSDAMAFRKFDYPVLCIGTLPENDLEDKNTWRLCHSMADTLSGCNKDEMKDFTNFLFNIINQPNTNNDQRPDEAERPLRT